MPGRLSPITDRTIRMAREAQRLQDLAVAQGYENTDRMLHDLYVVKKTPLKVLVKQLNTPMWTLRKRLDTLGITMRKRGGANNTKVDITKELLQEIARDGVAATSERLGVTYAALLHRVKKYVTEHGYLKPEVPLPPEEGT